MLGLLETIGRRCGRNGHRAFPAAASECHLHTPKRIWHPGGHTRPTAHKCENEFKLLRALFHGVLHHSPRNRRVALASALSVPEPPRSASHRTLPVRCGHPSGRAGGAEPKAHAKGFMCTASPSAVGPCLMRHLPVPPIQPEMFYAARRHGPPVSGCHLHPALGAGIFETARSACANIFYRASFRIAAMPLMGRPSGIVPCTPDKVRRKPKTRNHNVPSSNIRCPRDCASMADCPTCVRRPSVARFAVRDQTLSWC